MVCCLFKIKPKMGLQFMQMHPYFSRAIIFCNTLRVDIPLLCPTVNGSYQNMSINKFHTNLSVCFMIELIFLWTIHRLLTLDTFNSLTV